MLIDELFRVGSEFNFSNTDDDLLSFLAGDQLEDGHLLDVRLVTSINTVGLLLDLRHAYAGSEYNTAALVIRDVQQLVWNTILPDPSIKPLFGNTSMRVWSLPDFVVSWDGPRLRLQLGYFEKERLTVVGGSMAMFYGDVVSVPELQPSLPDDRDAILSWQFQSWSSEMTVRGVSRSRSTKST